MRQREAPSYSSSRVQRATRINTIEAARLEQTLQYLEKAKLHQCRLSNQDIRLISLSLDYIQMSSGRSPEAWRPPAPTRPLLSPVASDDEEGPGQTEAHAAAEHTEDNQSPFFLYGERIWERKRRRIQRPMSAVPSRRTGIMDTTLSSLASDAGSSIVSERPKSSPGKQQMLSVIEAGRFHTYPSRDSSSTDGGSSGDRDSTFITRGAAAADTGPCGGRRGGDDLPVVAWGPCDGDNPSIVLSTGLSRASTPRGRVTPHQDWEDDTSHVTKKILKSQALAQKGKQSLYMSSSDVMTSAAARSVRGLARQIRVSASAAVPDHVEPRSQGVAPVSTLPDFPPTRPAHQTQDGFNRRATVSEIVNQRRPTLSSGAWKSYLGQSSDAPMSLAARRQKVLETKKEVNESRNQLITKRVKEFVASSNARQLRPKTACA